MSWLDDAEAAEARADPYGLHAPADTDFSRAQALIGGWYARVRAGEAGPQAETAAELPAGRHAELPAPGHGTGRGGSCRDWRLIRGAEARAREIGMRASVPDPSAAATPAYQADAAAWGSGQGIGADPPEPEAGA
jgi:hypothetical protein